MTRIYLRLGDRLTYIGGLPTAETFALPYLEIGVTTYSPAIFNFLPHFAIFMRLRAGATTAMSLMLCNLIDTQWGILVMMSLAFFGKGFGALGWTVVSDTSAKGMVGLNG